MPNIKSAIKRVKVTEKKNLQNRTKRSELRTAVKSFYTASADSSEGLEALKNSTIAKIDRAVAKNLLHKNAAARKKSQITKAFNTAMSPKAAE